MERAVAMKKLVKLLGKNFSYEVNPRAPSADEREAAKQVLPSLETKTSDLEKVMNARRQEVLANDGEYQTLLNAYRQARKESTNVRGKLYSYRFTVGHVDRAAGFGFFHVSAQGDSWEDVIAKLEREKKKESA